MGKDRGKTKQQGEFAEKPAGPSPPRERVNLTFRVEQSHEAGDIFQAVETVLVVNEELTGLNAWLDAALTASMATHSGLDALTEQISTTNRRLDEFFQQVVDMESK